MIDVNTWAGVVLHMVLNERVARDAKWGEQNHPDGTGSYAMKMHADIARRDCDLAARDGRLTWRHILDEEVAEALAESDPEKLKTELIQVAAVAVAWVEKLDREAVDAEAQAQLTREEEGN